MLRLGSTRSGSFREQGYKGKIACAAVRLDCSVGQTWHAPDGASCRFCYLCSWQGQSLTGIQFNVSQRNIWQEYPGSDWDTYSSWTNNQTPRPRRLVAPGPGVHSARC